MKVNKYPDHCMYCYGIVPENGGTVIDVDGFSNVAHLACAEAGQKEVVTFYFPGTGNSVTQNRNGRCEDAPCCGCCS